MTTRRSLLRGAGAALPFLAFPDSGETARLAPPPAPRTQKEIASRVFALAAEISTLLDELDGGHWHVKVSPTFHGAPVYDVQPIEVSARVRLEQGLASATRALNELHPGAYRTSHSIPDGVAFIVNDSWKGASA